MPRPESASSAIRLPCKSEYCRYFHSAAQSADVHGCVYFTRDVDTSPYVAQPHHTLTRDYPIFRNAPAEVDKQFAQKEIELMAV